MYNRFEAIGHLGTDPEIQTTKTGKTVTHFRLAVNSRQASEEGSGTSEETLWLTVSAWERLAEICSKYLHKGDRAMVAGRLSLREYTGKDGTSHTAAELTLSDLEMLSSPPKSESLAQAS
jgi:single-strand DNA-binding protein